MNTSTLVQKLWNYCNVLRDDGMSYGDYVEQLTYLLFLKMADERGRPQYHQPSPIPACFFAILDSPLPHVRKPQKRVQENREAGDGRSRISAALSRRAAR